MLKQEPKVITFNSGKGGAGKTTICIAMAYLLKDMGFNCLLIDFDLHTHGASYYFREKIIDANKYIEKNEDKYKGICELLNNSESEDDFKSYFGQSLKPIKINNEKGENYNFYFLPSTINDNEHSNGAEFFAKIAEVDKYFDALMVYLIEQWSPRNEINYIFIDCPAGCSLINKPVWLKSDISVFVLENDRVSLASRDDLIRSMSGLKKISVVNLKNKIDIFERNQRIYPDTIGEAGNNLVNKVEGMTSNEINISPLPYDNIIRKRFANQETPLFPGDLGEKPPYSPLLIAIISTIEDLFRELKIRDTEIIDKIRDYNVKKIIPIYENFRDRTHELKEELDKINENYKDKTTEDKIIDKVKTIFEEYDQYVSMLLAYKYAIEARQKE
jgi:cellulose biosynthesis protein BcsQ